MSSIQLLTLGGLWTVLLILGVLVFVLYRQVDKAYSSETTMHTEPLPPGARAPELEIVGTDGQLHVLSTPSPGSVYVLLFLMPSCSSCIQLVKSIKADADTAAITIGLVSGETTGQFAIDRLAPFRIFSLAHPPDALGPYKVSRTPMAYVLLDGTILAGGYVGSLEQLKTLVSASRPPTDRSGNGHRLPLIADA